MVIHMSFLIPLYLLKFFLPFILGYQVLGDRKGCLSLNLSFYSDKNLFQQVNILFDSDNISFTPTKFCLKNLAHGNKFGIN